MAIAANAARWTGTRPLRSSLYGDLIWRRPGVFRRELVLESGSETLASLRWEKALSSTVTAESADGRWTIRRRRRLGSELVVEAPGAAQPVATMTRNWRGVGELQCASGASFRWEREGFWRPEWFWSSERTSRLLVFQSHLGWTTRHELSVNPGALGLGELPVLVLLGGYLMSQTSQQHSG